MFDETFNDLDDLDERAHRVGSRTGFNIATPGWVARWRKPQGLAAATVVGLVPVGKSRITCDWATLAETMRELAEAVADEDAWSDGLSEPISAAIRILDLLNDALNQARINEIDLLPFGWMLLVEVDSALLSKVEQLGVDAKKLASVFESLGVRVSNETSREPKGPPPPDRRAAIAHTKRLKRERRERKRGGEGPQNCFEVDESDEDDEDGR